MTSLCVYPCVYCIYYFYIFITDCSLNTAILENKTHFTDIHTCGNKQEDKVHCNEHFFSNKHLSKKVGILYNI